MKLEFSPLVFEKKKKPQISNFMKIRPVGTKLFHKDGRTGGRTGTMKRKVAFRNFIVIFIYCNWVVTRWQWLLYM